MPRNARLTVLVVAVMVAVVSVAAAQSSRRRARSAPRCRIGSISFRCPTGYRAVPLAGEKRFALFRARTEETEGFFVAPASGNSETELSAELRAALLVKLFPRAQGPFTWTAQDGPDQVSKFEIGGGGALGLSDVKAVTLLYRRVKFQNAEFWVGGLFDSGSADEARETSAQGGVSVSMGECNAAVQVIYSITGEKEDPEHPPCELRALIQPLP